MGRKAYLEAILLRKDEEIASLESRLETYIARTSLLQTRLLSTLDALDVMDSAQAQELASRQRTIDRLNKRMDRYIEVVKSCEAEKEDMRDAIMKLVEKVETSSDYSTWPHSQICLSSLHDPIGKPPTKFGSHRTSEALAEEDLLSYASSIISSLRRERDNERQSHARTRDTSEARILSLEARVSRREAELEYYVSHAEHGIATTTEDLANKKAKRVPNAWDGEASSYYDESEQSDDQIIAMLDVTVTRNKKLEGEIKMLYKRLEEARAGASSNASTPLARAQRKISSPEFQYAPSTIRTSSKQDIRDRTSSSTRSPVDIEVSYHSILLEMERQIRALGDKIDSFAEERTNMLQTLPFLDQHLALSRPSALEQHQDYLTDETPTDDESFIGDSRDQFHEPPPSGVEDEQQIPDVDILDRMRLLESECSRLQLSESELRGELLEARTREEDLMRKISLLQQQIEERGQVLHPVGRENEIDVQAINALQDIKDEISHPKDVDVDGEMSMDLATPLTTVTILSHSSSPSLSNLNVSDELETEQVQILSAIKLNVSRDATSRGATAGFISPLSRFESNIPDQETPVPDVHPISSSTSHPPRSIPSPPPISFGPTSPPRSPNLPERDESIMPPISSTTLHPPRSNFSPPHTSITPTSPPQSLDPPPPDEAMLSGDLSIDIETYFVNPHLNEGNNDLIDPLRGEDGNELIDYNYGDDSQLEYVDPPSIPLPLSPEGGSEGEVELDAEINEVPGELSVGEEGISENLG